MKTLVHFYFTCKYYICTLYPKKKKNYILLYFDIIIYNYTFSNDNLPYVIGYHTVNAENKLEMHFVTVYDLTTSLLIIALNVCST